MASKWDNFTEAQKVVIRASLQLSLDQSTLAEQEKDGDGQAAIRYCARRRLVDELDGELRVYDEDLLSQATVPSNVRNGAVCSFKEGDRIAVTADLWPADDDVQPYVNQTGTIVRMDGTQWLVRLDDDQTHYFDECHLISEEEWVEVMVSKHDRMVADGELAADAMAAEIEEAGGYAALIAEGR